MLSRANLLIQRDFEDLKEKPYEGIEIDLISPDDVYEWTVKIKGNQGSIWEVEEEQNNSMDDNNIYNTDNIDETVMVFGMDSSEMV